MVRLVRAEKMVLSCLVFARKIATMILIQNICFMVPLMIYMAFMPLYMWEIWDVTLVTHKQWKVVQYFVWAESAQTFLLMDLGLIFSLIATWWRKPKTVKIIMVVGTWALHRNFASPENASGGHSIVVEGCAVCPPQAGILAALQVIAHYSQVWTFTVRKVILTWWPVPWKKVITFLHNIYWLHFPNPKCYQEMTHFS